jgi:hypothetical protein
MRIHEAEDELARQLGIRVEDAMRLLDRAINRRVLACSFGKVRPARPTK